MLKSRSPERKTPQKERHGTHAHGIDLHQLQSAVRAECGQNVSARIDGEAVILEGTVRGTGYKHTAERIALRTSSVRTVINRLQIF